MTTSGWQLQRVNGPDVEPVSLADMRAHLKLDADLTLEDPLIQEWITTAREMAEEYTGRTWCQTTWELQLDDFPRYSGSGCYDGSQVLPQGTPLVSIDSVTYLENGVRTELPADQYQVGRSSPAFIRPLSGAFWPSSTMQVGSVAIRYTAGYVDGGSPAGATKVPGAAKQVIKAIVTRWFEERKVVDVDDLLEAGLWRLRIIA